MERPRDIDLAERLFGAPQAALALMRAAWPATVGPEVARRSEVAAFEKGVLHVRVADATWRRSLVRMRREILVRLRRLTGRAAPHTLAFVEGALASGTTQTADAPPMQERLLAPAPPPPTVREAAETIPDPVLREQFLASAARYFGRFRPTEDGTRESEGTGPPGSGD